MESLGKGIKGERKERLNYNAVRLKKDYKAEDIREKTERSFKYYKQKAFVWVQGHW